MKSISRIAVWSEFSAELYALFPENNFCEISIFFCSYVQTIPDSLRMNSGHSDLILGCIGGRFLSHVVNPQRPCYGSPGGHRSRMSLLNKNESYSFICDEYDTSFQFCSLQKMQPPKNNFPYSSKNSQIAKILFAY